MSETHGSPPAEFNMRICAVGGDARTAGSAILRPRWNHFMGQYSGENDYE